MNYRLARSAELETVLALEHIASVCTTPKLFTSTNESNSAMSALLSQTRFEPSGVIHNWTPEIPRWFTSGDSTPGPGSRYFPA